MSNIKPFTPVISTACVEDLQRRLQNTRWPEPETTQDWSQGIPLTYTKKVIDHWLHTYDMQRLATRLNAWPNFTADIDGLSIHFLHIRSSHDNAQPLLLTHGWPGSVVEFLNVIGPLSEPDPYGAQGAQAYHLIIPSLPGFGFSGKPTATGWSTQQTAKAWAKLMSELGYESYFAQPDEIDVDAGFYDLKHVNPLRCSSYDRAIAIELRRA